MTNGVNGSSAASNAAANATTSTTNPAKSAVNKETFLQLLVAQIKNQNPLNPADGVQFLTQLAQFSELEQMMSIRSDLTAIREQLSPPAEKTEGETNV